MGAPMRPAALTKSSGNCVSPPCPPHFVEREVDLVRLNGRAACPHPALPTSWRGKPTLCDPMGERRVPTLPSLRRGEGNQPCATQRLVGHLRSKVACFVCQVLDGCAHMRQNFGSSWTEDPSSSCLFRRAPFPGCPQDLLCPLPTQEVFHLKEKRSRPEMKRMPINRKR